MPKCLKRMSFEPSNDRKYADGPSSLNLNMYKLLISFDISTERVPL